MTDARLLASEPFCDFRGIFAVTWEAADFATLGIEFTPTSSAHSYNNKALTLRGMHFQQPPNGQAKVVTCVSGRIFDVIADLRPQSPTFLRWAASELSAASGQAIYIPAGFAHGYLTLTDDATVAYLIDGEYQQHGSETVRWNDPALGIVWPTDSPIITERDNSAADFVR